MRRSAAASGLVSPAGRNPRARVRTPGLRALVLAFRPATRGQHRRRRRAREIFARERRRRARVVRRDFVFRVFVTRDFVSESSAATASESESLGVALERLAYSSTSRSARRLLRGACAARRRPTTARTPCAGSTPESSSSSSDAPSRLDVPREIRRPVVADVDEGRDGGVSRRRRVVQVHRTARE